MLLWLKECMISFKNFIIKILHILILIYLLSFVPVFWGWHPLVVISGSMEPVLNVGALLYYHEYDIEDFKKDDILVYKVPNHIISHRVVESSVDGFVTKGDANNTNDSKLVKEEQIMGIGTNWCIKYLGYYVDFVYHHKQFLYISISIFIIDLFNDLYKQRKERIRCIKYDKEN